MKWDSATILWRRPLKKIKYLSRSDLAQPFLHSKYLVKQKSIGSWLKKTPFWIGRLARLVHTSEEHITNSFQLQRKGTYSKEVIIIASRSTNVWNEPSFLSRIKVTFIINEVFRCTLKSVTNSGTYFWILIRESMLWGSSGARKTNKHHAKKMHFQKYHY